jgi:3-hydroxyacyl-CoA dehydrogenase
MKEIQQVAVIGSGVMGAAIAAHVANSGVPVLLLDIVPKDAKSRNQLAEGAIEKLLKTKPSPLTHKRKAKLITAGNLEDDLAKLKDVDWVIEAVIENLDIKRDVYRKINGFRKEGSITSSNTSTIPLAELIKDMPQDFSRNFLITHFFNPPRYMRLLELVTGPETRKETIALIRNYADVGLGKGIVDCKDTPGFIANRIGCFWLTVGMVNAFEQGISVEEADAVMGKPIGVPKTGIFGLMDLIGIDLLPLIAKEMSDNLPESDTFCQVYTEPELVTTMIKDGRTGRKGDGGFYRLSDDGGKKVKTAIDLKTGEYKPAARPRVAAAEAARGGLRQLLTHDSPAGKYAWEVISETLRYSASLVPEIADDVHAVDEAMRLGYNWKYGPFELIDNLGDKDISGPKWFADALREAGKTVPPILEKIGDGTFYQEKEHREYFAYENGYTPLVPSSDAFTLADVKRNNKPVVKNGSASLWDIGDGVACLEFTSKMNSLDPQTLEMIFTSVEHVKNNFKAMVIANDGDNFSVGANIGVLLFVANIGGWKMIEGIIKQGQDAMMALKFAPFPVVGAPSGMALGGGCEMLLHCDAVQAHVELYSGLVEVGVGLVPGWGGCKEMIVRQLKKRAAEDSMVAKMGGMFSFISPIKTVNTMPAISKAFEYISMAKVSTSAEEAKDMLILNEHSGISMNRKRVIADAKARALSMAEGYTAPDPYDIYLPGRTARTALHMAVNSFVKSGKATKHDEVVSKAVAEVLSGNGTDINTPLSEQEMLDLERRVFVEMVKHPDSMDRIEHMLETGKPLRN